MSPDHGAVCGPDCGWCHQCTPAYDRPNEQDDPFLRCAVCEMPIERVSIAVPTTPYHSVVVCSDLCRANLEASLDD